MATSQQYAGSGIEGLDKVLGGGFPRGQLSLIRGASGVGKTTLSLQFLIEGARHGEPVLYLGTSETEKEIRRVAQSHGWSLDGVTLHYHSAPSPAIQQTMLHPAEVELPQTMENLLSVVDRTSPKRLAIDSLTEIRMLARDELWYRRQLARLKQRFVDEQCTVLLVEIDYADGATLASVANGVAELMQYTPQYGPDRRRLRVVKVRGEEFSSGYHDYHIRRGGIRVFPRLSAAAHRQRLGRELTTTGLEEMDTMLHGGLARGTTALLLGPSGTGKSLIATQLAVAAAERGEYAAIYVFDERVQTLFQRAEGLGLSLQQHVDDGLIQVLQIDPAELNIGEFSESVRRLVLEKHVRLVVIDSLNGYAYAMPEERSLSIHLHELSSYLNQQQVMSVFTMTQHGLVTDKVDQPFDVSYIADTVMLFRPFEFAGKIYKALSIYKNRSGPHETSIRELKIGPQGIALGEPLRQFRGILTGSPEFLGERLDGTHRDPESADS